VKRAKAGCSNFDNGKRLTFSGKGIPPEHGGRGGAWLRNAPSRPFQTRSEA
jgi:hypothetical protein